VGRRGPPVSSILDLIDQEIAMSLSSTTNKVIYSGNGATTVWPFSFPVLDSAHLGVILTDASGLETVLAASTYSVTGIGAPSGGSVTYPLTGAALPSGTKLTLLRTVPFTQGTVLSNQGGYYPEVVERRFDEIYMALQQLEERLGRASLYALSNPTTEQSNLALIQELQPMDVLTTQGDLLAHDGSAYRRLPRGGATQVLGGGSDLAWREIVMPVMHIHGLTYSKNAANTIDVAAGGCMSEDGTDWLSFAGLAGVVIDTPFGTGSGALDTGSIANADYWLHLVKNLSTGTVKPLVSLSRTAPTMPADYTKRRVFGWLKRSGGSIVDFLAYEIAGGGLDYCWKTPIQDVLTTSSTVRAMATIRVPIGLPVATELTAAAYDTSSQWYVRVMNPGEADVPVTANNCNMPSAGPSYWEGYAQVSVRTDVAGNVAHRASAFVSSLKLMTNRFILDRR